MHSFQDERVYKVNKTFKIVGEVVNMSEKHNVRLSLTDLEWEIVSVALGCSIKKPLILGLDDLGYNETEKDIMNAWDKVSEKWNDTW